jgi:glycosyltransferase involved in cell wall biosynthesis
MYAAAAAARARKPLVISPRGMLSPVALAFSGTRKMVAWRLFQAKALRQAACLHATSEAEFADIRALGLTNPVAIIPNGIDLPPDAPRKTFAQRTVLSLGRLHPKKGLPQLLRAWAQVETRFPDWVLRIAGPAEGGHDADLRTLASRLGLARISIEGPIYGPEKLAAYRAADLFVLPSLDENFGLTVAEALAAGTPVICTKGAPWAGLESQGCGWWVDQGESALAHALSATMKMPQEQLWSMGARGRLWMARDYSWDRIAIEMLGVYRWLVHR